MSDLKVALIDMFRHLNYIFDWIIRNIDDGRV
jgi:hypothetical protein